jgi:predicted methyltransferase
MKPAHVAAFLFALPLALPACTGIKPPPKQPLHAPAEEVSVRPGVNDDFLAQDVDVEHFVQQFEGESREIAASAPAIVAAMKLRKGQDVADVGAGTGLFEPLLAEAVGVGGKVYALDISPAFLERLRQRVEQEQLEPVEVRECSARSVELEPLSVDVAFVCDTYHHFEYPQSVLFSLHKAVRPMGRLYVVDFDRIPGVSRQWVLDHVRADRTTFRKEIEAAGFVYEGEEKIPGLSENYMLRFRRP